MAYYHDFWYTCVKWWYLRCFLGLWSKRTKNGPKWQKILSVSLLISGTVHHIWLCFLIHMCKIMISPAIFFIFSKLFFFWFFRRIKGQKMTLNYYQLQSIMLYILGNVDHYQDFWYAGVKYYLQVFFFIFLKKCNIVNIKILLFFIGTLQQIF